MRKVTIALIVLCVLLCTSAVVYAVVYCNKNPQAAVCQESDVESSYDDDDDEGEDCDADDSVAKGDMECIGIPGKEGTVTSTRKPTTTRTRGTTTKTTVTNKKYK